MAAERKEEREKEKGGGEDVGEGGRETKTHREKSAERERECV